MNAVMFGFTRSIIQIKLINLNPGLRIGPRWKTALMFAPTVDTIHFQSHAGGFSRGDPNQIIIGERGGY